MAIVINKGKRVSQVKKKIGVFRVTDLTILGRVDTHFLIFFFLGKNIILCILKGIWPLKMHKIIFFFQ